MKTEINYMDEELIHKYYTLVDNFEEIYQSLQIKNELNIDEIKKLKKKEIADLILEENNSYGNLLRFKKDKLIEIYIKEKQS